MGYVLFVGVKSTSMSTSMLAYWTGVLFRIRMPTHGGKSIRHGTLEDIRNLSALQNLNGSGTYLSVEDEILVTERFEP